MKYKNTQHAERRYSVLILVVLLSIAGFVDAQSSETTFLPEQLLPENTLAVCVFPNLQKTVETFHDTLLSEILNDERRSILIQQSLGTFAEKFQQNAGFRLVDLWSIFNKSVAFALLDISSKEAVETGRLYPELVFVAKVTDSVEVLKNLLETHILRNIQTEEPTVEFSVESFAGVPTYGLANQHFQVHYAFLEDIFVLALAQQALQKIIVRSKEGIDQRSDTSSLINASSYRSASGYLLKEPHEVRLYVDIRKIWLTLQPYLRQMCFSSPVYELIPDILDQYNVSSLFWTFSYKDRGGYEQLFFKMHAEERDTLSEFSARPTALFEVRSDENNLPFISDRVVPANALYYRVGRVNLRKTWQQLSASINASAYPRQIELFHSWVQRIEDICHLDIEKDFLAAFGREMAIVCYAEEFWYKFTRKQFTLEYFPFFTLFQVRDEALLKRSLQKIAAAFHMTSHREMYQKTEIQAIEIPAAIAPFMVYTALIDNFLVVSVSRTVMQEVIAVAQHGASLASTEDYRKLSASFPATGYAKGYINIKKLSRFIQRFLNQNRRETTSQHLQAIFDTTDLVDRLSGMMWVTTVVNDGFLTESFSPIGGTLTGIIAAWLGVSLLIN